MKNILFYKYIELDNLEELRKNLFDLAKQLNLLGTVLLAQEGINGCLSGAKENTSRFINEMKKDSRFNDIDFKEGIAEKHTFRKFAVRIRPEIVTCKFNADIKNKAPYVEPKKLEEWLDNEEGIIIVDVRNKYEYEIGHFKNALELPMDVHREFPKAVSAIEKHKNKKIVTCCTGGVRCEKASAYLKEHGFNNVFQLHGGIIKYGLEVGNDHWEGKCLVFDTRGAIDIDPKNQSDPITQCILCNIPSGQYANCAVKSCDKRFIACDKCLDVLEGCCSKNCRHHLQKKETIAVY